MTHKQSCKNGCIRRMDVPQIGKGNFSYYKGTLDCPAQISPEETLFEEQVEVISKCGCCSFDDGISLRSRFDCRCRKGSGDWAECGCHNTPIVYTTCLSKINHGCCPYGLKDVEP